MRRWSIATGCDENGHPGRRVTILGDAFRYTDDNLGVTLRNIKADPC